MIRFFEIILKLTLCLPFRKFFVIRAILLPFHFIFLPHKLFLPYHKRLPKLLENLGVVFTKLGQSLSLKSFLFSKQTLESLSHLQENIKPIKIKIDIPHLIIEKTPIASASIAQVYVGYYKDKKVAVKILKYNVKKQIAKDFQIIKFFAKFLNKFISPAFQLMNVIEDIHQNILKEIDFTNEVQNILKMKRNLILDRGVYIPNIVKELCTSQIIVMDFVEDVSLRKIIHNNAKNSIKHYNKHLIAENIIKTYLNQTYRDGLFHGDMHSGNIFVKNNEEITILDFGIVVEISIQDRTAIATMLFAFLNNNYELALNAQLKANYITQDVFFNHGYRSAMKEISNRFQSNKTFEMLHFMQALFKTMNDYNVFVPKHLLMFNKTILYIEDMIRQLDPTFEPFSVIYPWIQRWYYKQKILTFIKNLQNF